MHEQLEHLQQMTARPNLTLQVLPFSSGEHVAMATSFTLLTLDLADDQRTTWVYLEELTRGDCVDAPSRVDVYRLAFDRLSINALSERDTKALLKRAAKDLNP